MAMAQPLPDRDVNTQSPRTTADLRLWVRENLALDEASSTALFSMLDQVIARQRQLIEESKHEAIRALSEGFAAKMERLHHQLTEKDVTVSNIARYFEEVVADLTEKSHRDPKTKLLNFDWFMERVESFPAVEQRPEHRARFAHSVRPDPLGGLPCPRALGGRPRPPRPVWRRRILLSDPG